MRIKMEMEIASYQVGAGDYRAFDVSPVDAEGMSYPPIADFDSHDDALAFCRMKNSQIPMANGWTPQMLAVWGAFCEIGQFSSPFAPELAGMTYGQWQEEAARRLVAAVLAPPPVELRKIKAHHTAPGASGILGDLQVIREYE